MGRQPREGRSGWGIVVDAATIVIALSALAVTAAVLRSRHAEPDPAAAPADRILTETDWSKAEAQGTCSGRRGRSFGSSSSLLISVRSVGGRKGS